MASHIFISYRTSDGKDKATALARDLGSVFGDEQVFLDKDDLRGGSQWRVEVQRSLGQRPVLLLLMTPQLLAATDAREVLRIDDSADPVRRELSAALDAGAQVIPLLCDGIESPPDMASLRAPFNRLGELTWRKLRAYDWQSDVQRIEQDLVAAGVPRLGVAAPRIAAPRNRLVVFGAAVSVTIAVLTSTWVLRAGRSAPAGVSGEWVAAVQGQPPFTIVLRQEADKLELTSLPVDIKARPDWAEHRKFWRERFAADLDHVVYRGEGKVITDPGAPLTIDVALRIVSHPGDQPIDGGNLHAARPSDAQRAQMDGTLWLNSAQADKPIRLQRKP